MHMANPAAASNCAQTVVRLQFGVGGRSEAYGYVPEKPNSSMSSAEPVAGLPRCELSARADAWEAGRGCVTMPAALFCFVYGGSGVTGSRRHGWLRAGAVHYAESQTTADIRIQQESPALRRCDCCCATHPTSFEKSWLRVFMLVPLTSSSEVVSGCKSRRRPVSLPHKPAITLVIFAR